jgi:glycerol-3-phosphate dehydrogenase
MVRDLSGAAGTRYDVLVIGGGSHGLFAAYDAAHRGLSVVLVERDDFGSGLSFNHQRTIHGGLRALEHGAVRKARQQIAERRAWALMAPHLIRPLPFLVGTYRHSRRSMPIVWAGLRLYDVVGHDRNAGVPVDLQLPPARFIGRDEMRRLFPGVRTDGLSGGAMWHDYQAVHPNRMNWAVALAAREAGARLFNYVEASGPVIDGGRVAGARVRDRETGDEFEVAARVTLIAAGEGAGVLMERCGLPGGPPLVRAMNLLLDRPAREIALAAPGRSGRMLTAVPWAGHTLVGTFQSATAIESADPEPPCGFVGEMLDEVNTAFPFLDARQGDVRVVHHGLTPAVVRHGRADLLPEAQLIGGEGRAAGAFALIGVKFTTARHAAAGAVDAIERQITGRVTPSRTAESSLPFAGPGQSRHELALGVAPAGGRLDADVQAHLAGWYGAEAAEVIAHGVDRGMLRRLASNVPVLAAEISHAVERSQALHLADAVLRRTPLASAGHPGREALEVAASIMGRALGWDESRTEDEIRVVEARLGCPTPR